MTEEIKEVKSREDAIEDLKKELISKALHDVYGGPEDKHDVNFKEVDFAGELDKDGKDINVVITSTRFGKEEKAEVTEPVENEMIKKLRELFGKGSAPEEEVAVEEDLEPQQPPLEEAIERALYSLNEISIYASYGRAAECEREAREAYEIVKALKDKFDEQNRIMEVLRSPDGRLHNEMADE